MKPADREQWILAWLRERQSRSSAPYRIDVLNAHFVDEYIDATGATHILQMLGAHTCPQLGRDLGRLHARGLLSRYTAGIDGGLCYQGFPRWVWSYTLV